MNPARFIPLGIVLVGDHSLWDAVTSTGQGGQRYTARIQFPRFETLVGQLEEWHPHLARVKQGLETKEWRLLTHEIVLASNGSFRRLVAVLEDANALAIRLNRPMSKEIIAMAIENLAPEE